jgi:hypothetical protein
MALSEKKLKKEKFYQNSDPTDSVFYSYSASYPVFYFLPLASQKKKTSPISYHIFYLEELVDFTIFLLVILHNS